MALIEQTLFGERDKVATAIERLRFFEPEEGYFLAFSGGKDSCVIKALAVEAGVKFDAHYNVTTVDPPELMRFIKQHHPDVAWDRPKLTMWELIRKKKMLPTRTARFCCQELKERGGKGRLVITGIRRQESGTRAKRNMTEDCRSSPGKRFLHVIIDWTEDDVWEYLRGRGLPYCCLYDEGWKRVGCVGCPFIEGKGRARDFSRWPRFGELWRRAAESVWNPDRRSKRQFASPQEYFDWWMGDEPYEDDDQPTLFT